MLLENPDQFAVGIGKIPILTFASSNKKPRKTFSSNSNSIDIFRRPNHFDLIDISLEAVVNLLTVSRRLKRTLDLLLLNCLPFFSQ